MDACMYIHMYECTWLNTFVSFVNDQFAWKMADGWTAIFTLLYVAIVSS